ncbi:helix-turn-helix transcriptional regulator [Tissierella carlieri]|uniref:Helix-turn-helix transcriptional regulator n=1 Tax=Tissierella carlieri TaxID=689904 RepID=A0ABT1S4Y0_9FIRM|nr:helix-turn-helix transcriptional regulator [Tissierella carlieri]MCQ4921516.1 helix-turn-helix transcriptional regulator [Tissierella carlieri]
MEGKNLEAIRIEKELSHNEIAKSSGISRSFYTLIENGNRTPSMGVAKKISLVLDLTLDEFFHALEVTKRNINNHTA